LLEPRLKKLYTFIKSKTQAKILHHTDGAIKPILNSLIAMGVDAVNPLQVSASGMDDLVELKKTYGKSLTFWGGIDTQSLLPFSSTEDVRKSVRKTIDILNEDGGYVLCAVHNIQKDVPPQNIVAMYQEAISS
jgi:uroporphyrinogen decarboxylase